jgi:hypothetical protein
MAWGFNADCPDCGHHWAGIETTLFLGPRSAVAGPNQHVFCPRCYHRLWLPLALDRSAWRRWYDRFLAEAPARPGWVLGLLGRIDAEFASAGWYESRAIEPGVIDCPGCRSPMLPGASGDDHLLCPACGSLRPVRSGSTSHVILAGEVDGFA